MRRKRNWLAAMGLFLVFSTAIVLVSAYRLSKRFEPYIREQAVIYLEKRFDSEAEIAALHVTVPKISPLRMLLDHGHGTTARVDGEGISLRHKGRRDVPPMFAMKRFSFEVDLGSLFDTPKMVRSVTIDGMEITIPPKGQRPELGSDAGSDTGVIIEEVQITNSALTILPRDSSKNPLQFDLHNINLRSAGTNVAMLYDATLTNAKPPGEIRSMGRFGPWAAGEPGDTPLAGEYEFSDADLGVFRGIAGILQSTGTFEGTLSTISVQGRTRVPDFRLTRSGNAVPLSTEFDVLVDGTNGDTVLKPVRGVLGKTKFTTSGGIIKHEKNKKRSIGLDVHMPDGRLRDVLTLAMDGSPFMEGRLALNIRIDIPPLTGKVIEKLQVEGHFELKEARFLRSKIQDQIDTLSRRGQGQPKNEEIVEVVSGMAGAFRLDDEVIRFSALSFAVPGAGVDLSGAYDLDRDLIDFHGTLRLKAKVSQTMTGWKRWALKPVDPFFAKQGAGTLLKIQVTGNSKEPRFGRYRGE